MYVQSQIVTICLCIRTCDFFIKCQITVVSSLHLFNKALNMSVYSTAFSAFYRIALFLCRPKFFMLSSIFVSTIVKFDCKTL